MENINKISLKTKPKQSYDSKMGLLSGSIDVGNDFDEAKAWALFQKWRWLASVRIDSFLVNDTWNTCSDIPMEWKRFVDELLGADFVDVLIGIAGGNGECGCPSIDGFINAIYSLSLNLKYSTNGNDGGAKKSIDSHPKRLNFKMKEKKSYEISIMKPLIIRQLNERRLESLVDIGAGQGLVLKAVIGGTDIREKIAIDSDQNVLNRINDCGITRIHKHIDYIDECKTMFEDFPADCFIYSLHGCGSLSVNILKLFLGHCVGDSLLSIGCCYNLMNSSDFPLHSDGGGDDEIIKLTDQEKMAACQSPYRWKSSRAKTITFLRKHFYRSILQTIPLHTNDNHQKQLETMKIKNVNTLSFADYARKQGISTDLHIIDTLEKKYGASEKRIAFLWTMRSVFGVLVESLIQWDRLKYCRQMISERHHGDQNCLYQASLICLFDPEKSPRNLAILISKNLNKSTD